MATFTEMGQITLGHLGVGKTVSNVDTDTSEEARALRSVQEVALKHVLRIWNWSFAKKIASLALVEEDPNDEWAFSYRVPSDNVFFRKIQSGQRNDDQDSEVKYLLGADTSGELIFTDFEDPVGEYTFYQTNTNVYPPDFTLGFTYFWAHLVAARLSKGDPFKLKNEMLTLSQMWLGKAMATDRAQNRPDREPESEFIRARE